ncbi:MAG: hypothetical protein J6W30_04780 [Bacteroidales bacterium]|nr:hypothetical protein [Bacteroidales bacterium]
MKKTLLLLAVFSAIILLPSCATIFSGTRAKVTVTSPNVSWANLTVDGEKYNNVSFPAKIKVKRGFKPSVIEAENPDMEGSVTVDKTFNAVSILNLTDVIGWAIDAADGAIMKPSKKNYTIYMKPKKNSSHVEQLPKDEPTNQVEGWGTTVLENTIVRWDVQSRPQGADISWRVVSKTPEVKSTNNKYLMTTPYEATKALDIKGLTYQTSSNVRIILRCEKDGYMPQEKEFDVRMVLDQEEISAFFRLVKEE